MKAAVKISSDGTKRPTWHLVFHFYSSLFFFLLLLLDCKATNNDAIKSLERMKERVCVNPKICRLTGCRRETRKEKTNSIVYILYSIIILNMVGQFIIALRAMTTIVYNNRTAGLITYSNIIQWIISRSRSCLLSKHVTVVTVYDRRAY